MQEQRTKKKIALFDVDGTLTVPQKKIEQPMIDCINKLREKYYVGIVGGSNYEIIVGQIGEEYAKSFDWMFSENGTYALKNGQLFQKASISEQLGEEKLKKFINFCLKYIADIDIPVKRGTFIQFRNGMMNISPIGRNCSHEERCQYEKLDIEQGIRKKFVEALYKEFPDYGLKLSIGGQISFDVFPIGWDKTYCLQFLKDFEEVHFFGDKTFEGGNDHEIFASERTFGYTVKSYQDTIQQVNKVFGI